MGKREMYIQLLQRYYQQNGRSPKRREFTRYASAMSKVFGSWNKALIAAGIPVSTQRTHTIRYSKAVFVERFNMFVSLKGYPPGLKELSEYLKIPPTTIKSYIGSYTEFVKSLGFTPRFDYENIIETNDQLKQLYIQFSKDHGFQKGATSEALNQSSDIYNADVFVNRFGSMNELRKECGYSSVNQGGHKLYKLKVIKKTLLEQYNLYGRTLTQKEISKCDDLPSASTLLRYFKTTSLDRVWEILLRNERKHYP